MSGDILPLVAKQESGAEGLGRAYPKLRGLLFGCLFGGTFFLLNFVMLFVASDFTKEFQVKDGALRDRNDNLVSVREYEEHVPSASVDEAFLGLRWISAARGEEITARHRVVGLFKLACEEVCSSFCILFLLLCAQSENISEPIAPWEAPHSKHGNSYHLPISGVSCAKLPRYLYIVFTELCEKISILRSLW